MPNERPLPDSAAALAYFQQKLAFTIGPVGLNRWIKESTDLHVVDVRDAEDYRKGHIPGSVNLPKDRWTTNAGLARGKTNVFYCYSMTCPLAAEAAAHFAKKGFPVMELIGGFDEWDGHGFESEK
jgi:rhodanese-related sulfurtransferase